MASVTPAVVIMAGLPATGKSTIAHALSKQLGGVVLDKDKARAALFPEPWTEYTTQQDDFVIDVLLQSAAWLLGRPTIPPFLFMDGRVFSTRAQINHVAGWARHSGCHVKIIHTTCSDETAFQRLASGEHLAKNRTVDLYLDLKSRFQPIEEPCLDVDTGQPLESILPVCVSYLLDNASL